jgi:hypothetical protein
MAANAAIALQASLKDYFNFYNDYDPLFSWWVPKTYSETDSLLALFSKIVKNKIKLNTQQQDDGSGIIGNPIGNTELQRQLQYEWIAYSADELVSIANKEFAWCDAQMLKAANEMGFGNNWKAALEKVKQTYVPPGKQPEAMYDLYKQSVEFLKANDLVTLPPLADEDWSVYMMSPEQQRVSPFFLGGESLIISYPTSSMTYEEKMMSMRGNNPNFSRATVHHELLAGHHLQYYMMARHKTYRKFNTPFWLEGNALYWEMLLWDMKFPRTPEERIGMLFWRMHRCARIIFSLNYHLGKWTPQQCINFLVDRVGHERANAEGEVRRSFTGGYGPLYQIAYMIGGLQFMALKKELVDGGKMSLKQYHDAILHENSMPVEMLRALLSHKKLNRDENRSGDFIKNNHHSCILTHSSPAVSVRKYSTLPLSCMVTYTVFPSGPPKAMFVGFSPMSFTSLINFPLDDTMATTPLPYRAIYKLPWLSQRIPSMPWSANSISNFLLRSLPLPFMR